MTRRTRAGRARDQGFTLTELLIAMGLFGLLMSITFGVLIMVTNQTKDTIARQQAIQQARIGLSQIDRQVRSGNLILNPEDEEFDNSNTDPFYSMRILTQEDREARCAQWRVIDHDDDTFGNLEFRSWNPLFPEDVTTWSVVAFNVVEMGIHPEDTSDIDPDDPSTFPPFWVDDTMAGDTEAQFIRVTLRIKDPGSREDSKPISVTTVLTGRNTVFGYSSTSCSDVPPP